VEKIHSLEEDEFTEIDINGSVPAQEPVSSQASDWLTAEELPIEESITTLEGKGFEEISESIEAQSPSLPEDWLGIPDFETADTSGDFELEIDEMEPETSEVPEWLSEAEQKVNEIPSGEFTEDVQDDSLPVWLKEQLKQSRSDEKLPAELTAEDSLNLSDHLEASKDDDTIEDILDTLVPVEKDAIVYSEELTAESDDISIYESENVLDFSEKEVVQLIPEETLHDDSSQSILDKARNLLESKSYAEALDLYENLIEQETMLDAVIEDLSKMTYDYPIDSSLWQLIGDAYLRNNQITEALDAYTKAEELLR
jgi:tetratricopeptide (TPR) repeat protein